MPLHHSNHRPEAAQLDALARLYRQRGYLVLPHVLPDVLLDRYVPALAEFLLASSTDEKGPAQPAHPDVIARRQAHRWHSAEILQLVMHPAITGNVQLLMGEEPFLLQVGTLNEHSESLRIHDLLTASSRQPHVSVWIALKDVAADQGVLWLAEGSHRNRNLRDEVMTRYPQLQMRMRRMLDHGGDITQWRQLESDIAVAADALQTTWLQHEDLICKPLPLNRGDVVVMHQQLLHGIAQVLPQRQTRWCLLAQFGAMSPRNRYFDPQT